MKNKRYVGLCERADLETVEECEKLGIDAFTEPNEDGHSFYTKEAKIMFDKKFKELEKL